MTGQGGARQGRIIPALVVGGLSFAAWREIGGPLIIGGNINPLPTLAACGMGLSGLTVATETLSFLADLCGYAKARIPTGRKGKAAFVKSLKEVRGSLIRHGWGLYWGTFEGTPIFADIETSAYVIGPSGSGKTTRWTIPNIMALKGHPKVIYCYKSDIVPQVAGPLRKRGERLRVVSISGLYEEEVGQPTDYYNPLVLVCETFFRKGGLEEITDLVRELCCIIDPDDAGKDVNEASFWKSNNRRYLGLAILVICVIEGDRATLGLCLQTLNDKQALLDLALWAAGRLKVELDGEARLEALPVHDSPWATLHDPEDVANFAEFLRGLGSGIADILGQDDGKLADSVLSGARESAIRNFDITTRASKLTSRTTFRFSELKDDGPVTTAAFMLHPNKMASHAAVLGVLNWCMRTELRQHENKTRKVYLLVDEAGNLPWHDLEGDLTTLRAFGVVPVFVFQNFPAFAKKHGKAALETLLSEAEVVLALPGQRNPETLGMLERMLSNASVIARSNSANASTGMFSMDGYSLQEEAKPLMEREAIRTTKKGLLRIGSHPWAEVDLPSIAEIHPWRRQLSDSPLTGKPYLKRIRLRIKPYPRSLLSWLGALAKFVLTGRRPS